MTASSDCVDVLHHPQVVALLRRQRRVERPFRQAEDGVERRPQFVADVGQKLALGAVGLLGGLLGAAQLLLGLAARGDVGVRPGHAADPAEGVAHGHAARRIQR